GRKTRDGPFHQKPPGRPPAESAAPEPSFPTPCNSPSPDVQSVPRTPPPSRLPYAPRRQGLSLSPRAPYPTRRIPESQRAPRTPRCIRARQEAHLHVREVVRGACPP